MAPARVKREVQVVFEAFQRLSALAVKPMTAISDLATIHEDIISSVVHKRVALIVLPFHKMLFHDGTMEACVDRAYHHVNVRVLRKPPCSVAMLVDRALGGMAQVSAPDVSYNMLLLFFSGPDDHEALAYAARMAEHPGIVLTVACFTAAAAAATPPGVGKELEAVDEEAIQKHVVPGTSVKYEEVVAPERQDVASAIKALGKSKNLVVTRRSARAAPLVEKSDCPELGLVGSYPTTAEFSATASVLVVQRYDRRSDPSSERAAGDEDVEGAVVCAPMPSPAYTPTRLSPAEQISPDAGEAGT